MNCPNDGTELRLIPAGISKKTGHPYPAFFSACEQCGFKPEGPLKPLQAPPTSPAALQKVQSTTSTPPAPNWGAIGMAKAATALWAAALSNNMPDFESTKRWIEQALTHIKSYQNGENEPPF